jgi:hypothetical protein
MTNGFVKKSPPTEIRFFPARLHGNSLLAAETAFAAMKRYML